LPPQHNLIGVLLVWYDFCSRSKRVFYQDILLDKNGINGVKISNRVNERSIEIFEQRKRNIEKGPLTFILSPNGGEGRMRGGLLGLHTLRF
jgi:hypothetical protein